MADQRSPWNIFRQAKKTNPSPVQPPSTTSSKPRFRPPGIAQIFPQTQSPPREKAYPPARITPKPETPTNEQPDKTRTQLPPLVTTTISTPQEKEPKPTLPASQPPSPPKQLQREEQKPTLPRLSPQKSQPSVPAEEATTTPPPTPKSPASPETKVIIVTRDSKSEVKQEVEQQETSRRKEKAAANTREKTFEPAISMDSKAGSTVNKLRDDIPNKKKFEDQKTISVITLAGENRGASMQIGSAKEGNPIHIHRGHKLNPEKSSETTGDGEANYTGKTPQGSSATKEEPAAPRAYINSNVQSINNSIVFSSSITEKEPGVHFVALSPNKREEIKPTQKKASLEMHRADFKATTPENHAYRPGVRRRCLRGLFMEPSDSDPENPDTRHRGCHYRFGERGGINTEIL